MFEFLGDVERGISALYPYRVPITLIGGVIATGVALLAWRRGWLASLAQVAGRRPAVSAVVVAVLLLVTIPAGWYLASPLWTRTTLVEASPLEAAKGAQSPQEVAAGAAVGGTPIPPPSTGAASPGPVPSTLTTPTTPTTPPAGSDGMPAFAAREVRRGDWVGADDFHFAQGDMSIIETEPGRYILRVENFSIRNGPDLFVYLSPSSGGYEEGGLNLGELKATDGAFNYEVPEGTDLSAYRSAVVWCEQFAVLFATAMFHPE